MDLVSKFEIEDLKNKLNINEGEYFLTNAKTGENTDLIISHLLSKYSNING